MIRVIKKKNLGKKTLLIANANSEASSSTHSFSPTYSTIANSINISSNKATYFLPPFLLIGRVVINHPIIFQIERCHSKKDSTHYFIMSSSIKEIDFILLKLICFFY